MSLEQNKAIVLEFYKAYDQGDLVQAKEMVGSNVVVKSMESTIRGRDDFY